MLLSPSAPKTDRVATPDAIVARTAGNNAPVWLDDPNTTWLIVAGEVDVFAVVVRNGALDGARSFLFRASAGMIVPGVGFDSRRQITLIAVGGVDTMVAPLSSEAWQSACLMRPAYCIEQLERFVRAVGDGIGEIERQSPQLDVLLDVSSEARSDALLDSAETNTREHRIEPGMCAGVRRDVRWLSVTRGAVDVLGAPQATLASLAAPFPLAPGLWALADEEGGVVEITSVSTHTLFDRGSQTEALTSFATFTVECAARHMRRDDVERTAQLRARMAADAGASADALTAMAAVMTGNATPSDRRKGVPLLAAMDIVGSAQRLRFRAPSQGLHVVDPVASACRVAETSSVGYRRVLLERAWWTREVGPVLGFLELRQLPSTAALDSQQTVERVPVALVPNASGGYDLVNPETGTRNEVSEELARHLAAFGLVFYRGLPATALRIPDLWRFVTTGIGFDVRTLALVAALGAVLGLVLPVLSGYLFDDVIPGADRGGLATVFGALLIASISGVFFELTRSVAMLRLHTRVTHALQLAVFDRLIRLPATFFRNYSAGDLGQRAMSVYTIGEQVGNASLSALLGSVVACSSAALLLHYSVPLAMLCVGILLVNLAVSVVVSRWSMRYVREQLDTAGKLSGLLLELFHGIAKLRVAAAEPRAFARWSAVFGRQQQVSYAVGLFSLNLGAFYDVLEISTSIAMYALYAWLASQSVNHMTTGQFLAFSAAAGTFTSAGLSLSRTAVSMLDLLPTWERGKPLLETIPEVDFYRPDPGRLAGRIEVQRLTFSYSKDSPSILHGVSLEIPAGSFVALVGPSGSGKSTLLRLLLGFERAQSGSIRFDGHELSTVDVSAVRRQIGVVLQNASLTPGDILSNIVGASGRGLPDAWEAVRMAGMEEDLRAMPMGLHTLVSEGGGGLSGGQRQRLLIARALVGRPRILFFDEATSALDNRTQRMVSESVEQLLATRVVVAHRLSTIRQADRIIVLDGGRIVESGTYDELMRADKLFASMAKRQDA
ncbi:NHLP bacteriocin export ABC transporter permease/ATPase subunit [Gemmatimonas groenlandica]|uniref:NHLP bacteriocin export ABC transporter permease/ATPase subunit n=1 Tax=Gemmatimonas groenlandica TaxID=2732249 RepID=A0A6M4IPJ5_9BACT|nr:NHLP bacteriocin export ABC transporter permease/ATPase subunit [Gemmatimonas groenlandica]QJR35356.1 NHLP bacteriocin export ABC transporter permease/ATPase subunit [Gemmatimonas groenlandica]